MKHYLVVTTHYTSTAPLTGYRLFSTKAKAAAFFNAAAFPQSHYSLFQGNFYRDGLAVVSCGKVFPLASKSFNEE